MADGDGGEGREERSGVRVSSSLGGGGGGGDGGAVEGEGTTQSLRIRPL